jgi:hypothetical protein
LRRSHEANQPKSARRCAIATPPNRHESGTFRHAGAERRHERLEIAVNDGH